MKKVPGVCGRGPPNMAGRTSALLDLLFTKREGLVGDVEEDNLGHSDNEMTELSILGEGRGSTKPYLGFPEGGLWSVHEIGSNNLLGKSLITKGFKKAKIEI